MTESDTQTYIQYDRKIHIYTTHRHLSERHRRANRQKRQKVTRRHTERQGNTHIHKQNAQTSHRQTHIQTDRQIHTDTDPMPKNRQIYTDIQIYRQTKGYTRT